MKVILKVMKKNLISTFRVEYIDFIFSRIFRAIFFVFSSLIIYKYLFSGVIGQNFNKYAGFNDYLGYIIIGAAFYSYLTAIILNVGRSLMTETREGTLEVILLSPVNRLFYYCGNCLTQIVLVSFDFIALILLGYLLGVNYAHFQLFPFLISLIVAFISMFSLALFVSLIMIILRDTVITQNTVNAFLFLIGGFLFPVQFLPSFLKALAMIFPLSHITSAVRESIFIESSQITIISKLCYPLLFSILLICCSLFILRRIESRIIEKSIS